MARKRSSGKDSALDILMDLLAIPGKSGDELQVAEYICKKLKAAGLKESAIQFDGAHRKAPIKGNVGNLIVKLPGTTKGDRRMLMAHMDTVPVCVGSKPEKKGNFIRSKDPSTGLGADDRAGVAVTLLAALEILNNDLPHPPLTFLWTIQEEIGLHGARLVNLNALGKPKLVFNWDGGSASKLTIGATGGYRMKIEITGKGSHAGVAPEKGVSAIAIAGLAIADLQKNGWHGSIKKGSKLGTTNIGVIRGGNATNVVADSVEILAEARSHNATFRKKIITEIEKAFQNAAKSVKNIDGECGKVKFDGRLDYESFALKKSDASVKEAEAAVIALGREPELVIANGGLDANWISSRGFPTVSLGCGQLNQHMTTEALDVREFDAGCKIALRLATGAEG